MASRTGKLSTSDFMKMDKNDPRRQRWEETANKAHAQDMHELDKARYGSASRQKAVQDPDSLEARVRDNSSTYGKTAEGKAYLHNKDQQAKSQAGSDARTAARDYATQRKEDTKAAYLEGQSAGRAQGRSDQAAASRGRGRGGYGGPPRGYGGRGGDPRQMRGGRGRGRYGGRGIDPRQMGRGGSRGGGREMADPALVNKVGSHAAEQINKHNQAKGGPTFKHESSGPVSKELLDKFSTHMTEQMNKQNQAADGPAVRHDSSKPKKATKPGRVKTENKFGTPTKPLTGLEPRVIAPPPTPPKRDPESDALVRDYLAYKNKDRSKSNLSSDEDRRAMLMGKSSNRQDKSSSNNLASDSDRYSLLTGKGKSYLDQYRSQYNF